MDKLVESIRSNTRELVELVKTLDHTFLTELDLETWTDNVYDAPRLYDVDKYDNYNDFAIINISNGFINTIGLTECYDGMKLFTVEELSTDDLLNICDCL